MQTKTLNKHIVAGWPPVYMCPRDQGRDIPWREGCHNHASPVTSEGIPLGHTCPLSPGKECRLARRVSRVSPVTRPGKVYPLARRLSHVTPVAREGISCGGKAVTCDPCHQGRDIPWRESCHVCVSCHQGRYIPWREGCHM